MLLLCFGFLGGIKGYIGGGCAGSNGERDHESCLLQSMRYVPGNTGHGGRVLVSMNSNFFI